MPAGRLLLCSLRQVGIEEITRPQNLDLSEIDTKIQIFLFSTLPLKLSELDWSPISRNQRSRVKQIFAVSQLVLNAPSVILLVVNQCFLNTYLAHLWRVTL